MVLDPNDKNSVVKMLESLNNLEFVQDEYPEDVMEPLKEAIGEYDDSFKHPKCMFVFDNILIRKIINSLIKNFKKSDEEKLLAFGFLDHANKYI